MSDLVNGRDYLVDYYALVKLPRDSSYSEMIKALRVLRGQYHPDRLEQVAEEFKAKGKKMTIVITEALNTYFENEESKKSYDILLDGWTGPISVSGHPVAFLGDMSSVGLINTLSVPEDDENSVSSLLLGQASFSEAQFALIEDLAAEKEVDDLDPKLRAALIEGLTEKAEFLILQKTGLQIQLGSSSVDDFLNKQASDYALVQGELERTKKLIDCDKERLHQKISSTCERITSETPLRIAYQSGEEQEEITDSSHALSLLTKKLEPEFEEITNKLLKNAMEIENVTDTLSSLLKPVYLNPEVEIGRLIAVKIKGSDDSKITWLELKVNQDFSAEMDVRGFAYDDFTLDEEVRSQIIQAGVNLIEVETIGWLCPSEILRTVVAAHFDKLFPEESN